MRHIRGRIERIVVTQTGCRARMYNPGSSFLGHQMAHDSESVACHTSFPLERCPECGYLLTDHSDSGRCPECGEPFSNKMIVIFGWAHSRFNKSGVSLLYVLGICLGIFLLVDAGMGVDRRHFLNVASGRWWNALVAFTMFLPYGAGGAASIWFAIWWSRRIRLRSTRPTDAGRPTLQLRLSPAGYACRRGYGPIQYLHWIPEMEIDLFLHGEFAHLRIARLTPVGSIDWSTVVDIAFHAGSQQINFLRTQIDNFRHGNASSPHPC